jgi:predicted HD phosphohydrolase
VPTALTRTPDRQLNLRLAPGDCLIFDNTRILHARTAVSATGGRHLHVAAKRYLCTVAPGYFGLLSEESARTLARQGGPMTPGESAAFEALPYARDAVAVRRWDDAAKDPAVTPPGFAHFAPLLEALLGS